MANKIPLPKSLPQGEGLFSSPPCEEGAREWVDCHEVATKSATSRNDGGFCHTEILLAKSKYL
ncbi:hypothetical protein [Helicobacter sp. 23-1046]